MSKLHGFPTVYFLNHHIERSGVMEDQFHKWNIFNYKRFWSDGIIPNNYDVWSKYVYKPELLREVDYLKTCISISTLEMIRHWVENTDENYLILMEDDYDLSLIEYWHFDWETLMKKLPYDWDCIQLGFESELFISFFLHPKSNLSAFGPVMINRWYAKKLLKIHSRNGKYMFINRFGGTQGYRCLGIDQFFGFVGKTYQMPLITTLPLLDAKPKRHHFLCRDLYYEWWTKERDNFTLDQFFSYGDDSDVLMTKEVVNV